MLRCNATNTKVKQGWGVGTAVNEPNLVFGKVTGIQYRCFQDKGRRGLGTPQHFYCCYLMWLLAKQPCMQGGLCAVPCYITNRSGPAAIQRSHTTRELALCLPVKLGKDFLDTRATQVNSTPIVPFGLKASRFATVLASFARR